MTALKDQVDEMARDGGFGGAVRVERGTEILVDAAYGLADRRHGIANTVGTRFAVASATKGLTALVVASLMADGLLELSTPARSLLLDDLPLIDERVTIEHLLSHTSGIGDYFDEDAYDDITDYVVPVPVHTLAGTPDYLAVLDGFPQAFAPAERFAYCNGAYVVLALLAERASGVDFATLVDQRVCVPAGMTNTAFLRSDELPAGAATGYLHDTGFRTNVLHLPVVGSGDGGAYSTTGDISAMWRAIVAGRVVPPAWVQALTTPHSPGPAESRRYGMGFWLDESGDGIALEGYDAGVSFYSNHSPSTATTYTVIANSSEGAWPLANQIPGWLGGRGSPVTDS